MGNLEKKEIIYLLSIIKEVLSPVLLQLERYNEAVAKYLHDQLTNVYNRYGLDFIIKEQLNKNNMLYLLMIDIDNFKHINDTYGHDMGDEILVKVAQCLRECLGEQNVARIGGEEFIGLLPINEEKIKDKLDMLLNKVRVIKLNDEAVSISIGVANLDSIDKLDLAKKEADKKLYLAKNTGKDKYIL